MLNSTYVTESEAIGMFCLQTFLKKIDNNHPLKQFRAICPTTGFCKYDMIYINQTGGTGNCELKCRNMYGRNKAYKDGYWLIEPDKQLDDWVIIFSDEKQLGGWRDVWIYNLHTIPPLSAQTPINIFCSNSNRYESKYKLFLEYGEHWIYKDNKMELVKPANSIKEWKETDDKLDEFETEIFLYNESRIEALNKALFNKINNNNIQEKFRIKNELLIGKTDD